jgi:hypothetical protein
VRHADAQITGFAAIFMRASQRGFTGKRHVHMGEVAKIYQSVARYKSR